jgi:hypothetical protein
MALLDEMVEGFFEGDDSADDSGDELEGGDAPPDAPTADAGGSPSHESADNESSPKTSTPAPSTDSQQVEAAVDSVLPQNPPQPSPARPKDKESKGSGDGKKTADFVSQAGQHQGGFGGFVGETAGAIVGSFFGPEGTSAGAAIGGQIGGLVDKFANQGVPAGPGTTIDSGGPATVSNPSVEAALSVGQSMQRMAMQGLKTKAAPNGRGEWF